jgi:hypothetical protein
MDESEIKTRIEKLLEKNKEITKNGGVSWKGTAKNLAKEILRNKREWREEKNIEETEVWGVLFQYKQIIEKWLSKSYENKFGIEEISHPHHKFIINNGELNLENAYFKGLEHIEIFSLLLKVIKSHEILRVLRNEEGKGHSLIGFYLRYDLRKGLQVISKTYDEGIKQDLEEKKEEILEKWNSCNHSNLSITSNEWREYRISIKENEENLEWDVKEFWGTGDTFWESVDCSDCNCHLNPLIIKIKKEFIGDYGFTYDKIKKEIEDLKKGEGEIYLLESNRSYFF